MRLGLRRHINATPATRAGTWGSAAAFPGVPGLIPRNEPAIYDMLFRAASGTLKALARQQWQAEPGIIMVLHTWGQTMSLHPHAHCIVTGGGSVIGPQAVGERARRQ